MKRRLLWTIFTIAVILFAVAGCKLPFWSELYGTWVLAEGGDSWSLIFDTNSLTWELAGSTVGTCEFSIEDVDSSANHVLMTLESATGDLSSGAPIGDKFYMTYSISGTSSKNLYFIYDDVSYPPSAAGGVGPFIKD